MSRNRGRKASVTSDLQALAKRLPADHELASVVLDLIDTNQEDGTAVVRASDVQCAIVGSAAVEQALRIAIGRHLSPTLSPEELNRLFVGDSQEGTLSTFDDRINMAYGLGIVSTVERDDLKLVKLVRNSFAHAVMPISFADDGADKVVARLVRLTKRPKGREGFANLAGVIRYLVECAVFCMLLNDYQPKGPRGLFAGVPNLFNLAPPEADPMVVNALRIAKDVLRSSEETPPAEGLPGT